MNFLRRIQGSIKRNGSDWILAAVSLLLALGVWLVHNLGLNYSDFISVPVKLRCNIEGRAPESSGAAVVTARCRTTGYNFIESRRFARAHVRTLTVDRGAIHPLGEETYYMTSRDLQEYTHIIFGEKPKLEYYTTDTVFFRFASETSRKVAVEMPSLIFCRPQYMVRRVKLDPDSVIVYGDPDRLAALESVTTRPVRHNELSSSVAGGTKIVPVNGLRISESSVRYDIDVVRYVESKATLPIEVLNAPSGTKLMVIPSEAEISVRCEFPSSADPLESVRLYVDYREFKNSRNGDCLIHATGLKDQTITHSLDPEVCECITGLK